MNKCYSALESRIGDTLLQGQTAERGAGVSINRVPLRDYLSSSMT
jgi:hypothetical protein